MKIFTKTLIASALLSSVTMANAASLQADATVTAKVVEPARLTLSFTPGADISLNDKNGIDEGVKFGQLSLKGYKSGTAFADVDFTDTYGNSASIVLQNVDGNLDNGKFNAYIKYNDKFMFVNGDSADEGDHGGGVIEGAMSDAGEKFDLVTAEHYADGTVRPGTYSAVVTAVVKNQ